MFKEVGLVAKVSRSEFLLPNLGSLIMGLAWGAHPPLSLVNGTVLIVLSFIVINLSSAIGAQANTLFDHDLDSKDDRKVQLVRASESFGQKRLRILLFIESIVALLVVSLFSLIQGKPILLLMWAAGICLGYVYSAPPLRLKSRSWLAPISLILVLAVFPVLFAYYTLSSQVDSLFLLSLTGLTLTVYGVIVPTEIRDYFGDRAMGIETLTVRLGLVKASLLAILLLSIGATLTGAALFLEWFRGPRPMLSLLLLAIPVAVITVLLKLRMLYSLSREHESSDDQSSIAEEIVNLSAHNPQWIMMVTQTYSILSIILLVNKFVA